MIELDLQPGRHLRRQLDTAHRHRTAKRFRRSRFWRGVVEAIAWVILFVALGSLTRVLVSSQVATGSGSASVQGRALSEPWREGR